MIQARTPKLFANFQRVSFQVSVLFWAGVCTSSSLGQGQLTLEGATREAKMASPELQRLEAKSEGASWKKLEAMSGFLPHITVDGAHYLAAKYSRLGVLFGGNAANIPSAFPQTNLSVTASLTLFDGFGSWHAYEAAALNYQAEKLDLSRASFAIEREVRSGFYDALAAEELKEVADQNIKSLEDHLGIAKATERSGMGTRFNVLRLEAQLEEARAELVLATDNAAIARKNLARTMGQEKDDTRPLDGKLPEPAMDKSVSALTLDSGARDDVKAELSREAAVDHQSSAADAFWYPKIGVFAQGQLYKFGNFDPAVIPNAKFQSAYSVGLSLRWDLFDGGASLARTEAAGAIRKEAAARTRATLLQIPADFELWKRRFLYNSALYRARLRTIEKSQESVRLAKLGLRSGTSTHSEVLDAELDLFRARAGLVRAQLDAAQALIKLELTSGKSL